MITYIQLPAQGANRVSQVRCGPWVLGKLIEYPNGGVRFLGQQQEHKQSDPTVTWPIIDDYFDKVQFERDVFGFSPSMGDALSNTAS